MQGGQEGEQRGAGGECGAVVSFGLLVNKKPGRPGAGVMWRCAREGGTRAAPRLLRAPSSAASRRCRQLTRAPLRCRGRHGERDRRERANACGGAAVWLAPNAEARRNARAAPLCCTLRCAASPPTAHTHPMDLEHSCQRSGAHGTAAGATRHEGATRERGGSKRPPHPGQTKHITHPCNPPARHKWGPCRVLSPSPHADGDAKPDGQQRWHDGDARARQRAGFDGLALRHGFFCLGLVLRCVAARYIPPCCSALHACRVESLFLRILGGCDWPTSGVIERRRGKQEEARCHQTRESCCCCPVSSDVYAGCVSATCCVSPCTLCGFND